MLISQSSHERARPERPRRVEARLDALHDGQHAGIDGRPRVLHAVGAVEHRAGARGEGLADARRRRRRPRRRSTTARARRARRPSRRRARRADHVRQVGRAPGDLHDDAVAAPLRARAAAPTAPRRPRSIATRVELEALARRVGAARPRSCRRSAASASPRRPPRRRRGSRPRAAAPASSSAAARRARPGRRSRAISVAVRAGAGCRRTATVAISPSVPNEPANSFAEVVAGDVLDHLAARLGDRAVATARP